MKKAFLISNLILSLIILSYGIAYSAGHKVITGPELEAMMNDGAPLIIIDVREAELFRKGHLPGARNIPYDTAQGRILRAVSPKDRVVFVCHAGPMGDDLGKILADNGYPDVYNLKGGMRKWTGPLTKDAIPGFTP